MAICPCQRHLKGNRVCAGSSLSKCLPSPEMTYQTQRADLGGQGRRGTDFPTGAPQVHWKKETISASAERAPKSQLSLRSPLGGPSRTSVCLFWEKCQKPQRGARQDTLPAKARTAPSTTWDGGLGFDHRCRGAHRIGLGAAPPPANPV